MKTAGDLNRVAVLGAGTMGSGIAQVVAQAGLEANLQDLSRELVARGVARIDASLGKGVAKGQLSEDERQGVLARIHAVPELGEAVEGADVVIEAAPESLELKTSLFAQISTQVSGHCLLASNTSSLSISRIAAGVVGPGRFLGLHFFNPPPLMKLLEIVRGEQSSAEAIELARAFALRLGKEPILVRDSPGFASSRLGLVLGLEAIRMVEEGVASAADIDRAMKLGYRHPMGPLELTDHVGLDVRLAIAEHLARELDDRRFEPPGLLRRLVAEGKLGRKSGAGFHVWKDGRPEQD
ncbi:MAG: 3-hydroxyacyl-CoA dehydrogenase family protein [Planctomycetota bacterium]